MREVFADSFYWVALYNKQDSNHQDSIRVSKSLGVVKIVTTDEVLVESANLFLRRTSLHAETLEMVKRILANPNVNAIAQTRTSLLLGIEFFAQRSDKEYSLTDCISMQTMKSRGITEVLTHDHHFEQEGFKILFP